MVRLALSSALEILRVGLYDYDIERTKSMIYSFRDVSLSRNRPVRDAGLFSHSGTVPGNPGQLVPLPDTSMLGVVHEGPPQKGGEGLVKCGRLQTGWG